VHALQRRAEESDIAIPSSGEQALLRQAHMKRMPAWAIALIAAVGFAACDLRPTA
jgi:hypothetical protein